MADNNRVLEQIKLDLESCVGKRVKLKANRGRKKVVEAEGIIENTYPKLFVVKLDKPNSLGVCLTLMLMSSPELLRLLWMTP